MQAEHKTGRENGRDPRHRSVKLPNRVKGPFFVRGDERAGGDERESRRREENRKSVQPWSSHDGCQNLAHVPE
jgi:hypothetical protein